MPEIPDTPRRFFFEYVPERFAEFRSALVGKSSAGSMSFSVVGESSAYNLRLAGGELVVSEGPGSDVLLSIAIAAQDFVPVIVAGARKASAAGTRPEHQLLAFKVLTVERDRLAVLKSVTGTVSAMLSDGAVQRAVHLGIGAEPNPSSAQCRLECGLNDFLGAISGQSNPFQLLMDGKLRVTGNMQIPMVLAGLLA